MDAANLPPAVIKLLTPFLRQGPDALEGQPASLPANLEIGLHRRSEDGYSVETRFSPPGSTTEMLLNANTTISVAFDLSRLDELAASADWNGYGAALTDMLFGADELKITFAQAEARAGAEALRLRLVCGPTAAELHNLYWETLRHPLNAGWLAGNQKVLFSRYLASQDWQEIQVRPKGNLHALVAVANPADLPDYDLAAVDVPGEIARARAGLKGFQVETLPGDGLRCSLSELTRRLQDGYDILYLVGHGSFVKGQAWLWLENADGKVQRVSAAELAGQVRLLDKPPLLAVLASCESASGSVGNALQSLGPQLCQAGIPAVIAMQGKISMTSIASAMPVFFEKLAQDGVVDRALASARGTLASAGAPDAWMFALFMRLKDGMIWQAPQGDGAPVPVKQVWSLVKAKLASKPAAQEAIDDLVYDPADPDNQEAFAIQLKKAIRDDAAFAQAIDAAVSAAQPAESKGGVTINVGGSVGGSIVVGSNNTVNSD